MTQNIVGLDAGGSPEAPPWLTPELSDTVAGAGDRPCDDAEYDRRLAGVRQRMRQSSLDAMLVFRPSSIEYLCGYHTAETAPQPLLVTADTTVLYVPDLELGRALASSRVGTIAYCGYTDALQGLGTWLHHAVGTLPARARVGIEQRHATTPPVAVRLVREAGAEPADGDDLVERQRLVLSEAELACVERAAATTQAGVAAAVAAARRPGVTDSAVAGAVADALFADADSPSAWGPVVATGDRGGIPHSSWVGRPLADGTTTFLEFAGAHRRYHAPVMRTLALGEPGPRELRLADLAATALAAVLGNARAGVPCSQVAERAAAALGPLPDDVVFHHLFGYPVGLAHKPHWMDGMPFHIAMGNDEPLRAGMVFHVPASFRSFGRCGVGLSQTFVVEETGTRVLTHGPAELIVL